MAGKISMSPICTPLPACGSSQKEFLPRAILQFTDSIEACPRKFSFPERFGLAGFQGLSQSAHVAIGRWSWAGDAWDFDHDGVPISMSPMALFPEPKARILPASFGGKWLRVRWITAATQSIIN